MNITLPLELKVFIDAQVAQQGHSDCGDYVRELIERHRRQVQVRNLLLTRVASRPVGGKGEDYLRSLRERVRHVAAASARI